VLQAAANAARPSSSNDHLPTSSQVALACLIHRATQSRICAVAKNSSCTSCVAVAAHMAYWCTLHSSAVNPFLTGSACGNVNPVKGEVAQVVRARGKSQHLGRRAVEIRRDACQRASFAPWQPRGAVPLHRFELAHALSRTAAVPQPRRAAGGQRRGGARWSRRPFWAVPRCPRALRAGRVQGCRRVWKKACAPNEQTRASANADHLHPSVARTRALRSPNRASSAGPQLPPFRLHSCARVRRAHLKSVARLAHTARAAHLAPLTHTHAAKRA
jgi:hypothetical protein